MERCAPLITDGADTTANYDIVEAWMAHNSTLSEFYFRVNLAAGGQLPPGDYAGLEARLDCNRDGSYQGIEDMVIYYALDAFVPGLEEVAECQGSDYFDCDFLPEPNNSDTNPQEFGEEVLGTEIPTPLWNYEWKADVNGDASWALCLGTTIDVQFAAVKVGDLFNREQDVTIWVPYDSSVPTAVTLATFTATAAEDRAVLLNWETASELDILGFNLYRAEAEDGPQTQLNAELIAGQAPGSPEGAVYESVDEVVQPGATYWYWLEVVDAQGAPTLHGPVSATVPLVVSHRIYLPLVHK